MGELIRFPRNPQRQGFDLPRRIIQVLTDLGVEPLDADGTLLCWTCGLRFRPDNRNPMDLWWICPRQCNAG